MVFQSHQQKKIRAAFYQVITKKELLKIKIWTNFYFSPFFTLNIIMESNLFNYAHDNILHNTEKLDMGFILLHKCFHENQMVLNPLNTKHVCPTIICLIFQCSMI